MEGSSLVFWLISILLLGAWFFLSTKIQESISNRFKVNKGFYIPISTILSLAFAYFVFFVVSLICGKLNLAGAVRYEYMFFLLMLGAPLGVMSSLKLEAKTMESQNS